MSWQKGIGTTGTLIGLGAEIGLLTGTGIGREKGPDDPETGGQGTGGLERGDQETDTLGKDPKIQGHTGQEEKAHDAPLTPLTSPNLSTLLPKEGESTEK